MLFWKYLHHSKNKGELKWSISKDIANLSNRVYPKSGTIWT